MDLSDGTSKLPDIFFIFFTSISISIKFYHKEDWYEFNDSQVKYIGKNIENIESFPYAYALFYYITADF